MKPKTSKEWLNLINAAWAMSRIRVHGDSTLFESEVRNKNPELLEIGGDDIVKLASGNSLRGRSRPEGKNHNRDIAVMLCIIGLRKEGFTLKGTKDPQGSAVELVSEYFHISVDTVLSIWKSYNQEQRSIFSEDLDFLLEAASILKPENPSPKQEKLAAALSGLVSNTTLAYNEICPDYFAKMHSSQSPNNPEQSYEEARETHREARQNALFLMRQLMDSAK